MSFKPVSHQEIAGDILNIDAVATIPHIIAAERRRWHDLSSIVPSEGHAQTVASFFADRTEYAAIQTVKTTIALRLGYPDRAALMKQYKEIAAGIALGRFVGQYVQPDQTYAMGGDEFDVAPEQKFIVDYHEGEDINGAFSAIVHKDVLSQEPFEGELNLGDEPAWYEDRRHGLYVAVQSPAVGSASLIEELTQSTGTTEEALALLDPENSVNLLPYLSIGYIAATAVAY
jgi:hypothetical protein